MFQYLAAQGGNVMAIRTTGKLGRKALDQLLPHIEQAIRQHGKLRFYWEMEAFEGWEPLSFVRDRAFDLKHFNDFERIAMVGDKAWEQRLAGLMKPFTTAQLRYFDLSQKDEAMEWVTAM